MPTKKNSLVAKNGRYISEFRKRRQDALGRSYLFFRPDNMEQHVKPCRLMIPTRCISSGRLMSPGEYTYRCTASPIRLSPYGTERIGIDEAERVMNTILPDGVIPFKIPSFDDIATARDVLKMKSEFNKTLERRATQMLEEGRVEAL